MSQKTTGIKAVLSHPAIYSFVQYLVGARRLRQEFVEEYIRPFKGQRLLDIGCGTGDIVEHLPAVDYRGFDLSGEYVQAARRRFGKRAVFERRDINNINLDEIPRFDIVITMFLLHHLDDNEALKLFTFAKRASEGNGKLLTIDPCLATGQARFARYLISKDRGQNVRSAEDYQHIAKNVFRDVKISLRHDLLRIPYTHIIMECSN